MPSISTQTGWSWIQDLAVLQKLASAHKLAGSELSLNKEVLTAGSGPDMLAVLTQSEPAKEAEGNVSNVRLGNKPSDRLLPPIPSTRQESGVCVDTPLGSSPHSEVHLPAIIGNQPPTQVTISSPPHTATTTTLQSEVTGRDGDAGMAAHTVELEESGSEVAAETAESDVIDTSPSVLFRRLEQVDYSDHEDNAKSSDEEASSEEEDSGTSNDENNPDETPPNIPDLRPLADLSWPAILRYIRDSESVASQYFSLQNKEAVDRRMAEAKALMNEEIDGDQVCRDSSGLSEEELDSHIVEGRPETEQTIEEDGIQRCHFCGKDLPRRSLLEDTRDVDKIQEQDYICCRDYKDYTILVAVCMRQMVEKMRTAPPSIIAVKPHTKIPKKKLLEDKALTLLRRKQKWEEIQKRRQQAAESRRQMKGTKVIQFTLDSPKEQAKGWMVGLQSTKRNQADLKKKEAKKKRVEKREMFSAEILERLKQNKVSSGMLVQRYHDNGTLCSVSLPDRTGYCNYPSGRKAVVIYSLYEGALCYMVYEDSDFPQLLAYADELGRCCCYFKSGSVRFLNIPHFMLQLDVSSNTRRRLKSTDPDMLPQFQPVAVPLNKNITVKCNQDSTSLQLTFPNNHIKFTMSSKLHKGEAPLYSHQLQSSTAVLEDNLSRSKSRITHLLHVLQNVSQVKKLSKLESLYGTPQAGRGAKIQHPHRQEWGQEWGGTRKRTRSTGAIRTKHVSAEKHSKAMTLL